jgi:hypothetical protein
MKENNPEHVKMLQTSSKFKKYSLDKLSEYSSDDSVLYGISLPEILRLMSLAASKPSAVIAIPRATAEDVIGLWKVLPHYPAIPTSGDAATLINAYLAKHQPAPNTEEKK